MGTRVLALTALGFAWGCGCLAEGASCGRLDAGDRSAQPARAPAVPTEPASEPPCPTHQGDLTVDGAGALAELGRYCEVEGNLTFDATALDEASLPRLERVSGALRAYSDPRRLEAGKRPTLRRVRLPSVVEVGSMGFVHYGSTAPSALVELSAGRRVETASMRHRQSHRWPIGPSAQSRAR